MFVISSPAESDHRMTTAYLAELNAALAAQMRRLEKLAATIESRAWADSEARRYEAREKRFAAQLEKTQ